jgi:hypothetical protein
MARARSQLVDGQKRFTVFFAILRKRLHEQQAPTLQAGVLHRRYRMTYDAPDLHRMDPHSTRKLPTVLDRLCLVNVSGVVTPSPVGVAMLKLR